MGKRGPQPQSKELKLLRGNPGKRAITESPESSPFLPECPNDLLPVKDDWDHYGSVLVTMGILQESDGLMWDALWRTWAKYKELSKRRDQLDELVDIAVNDPNKEANTIKIIVTLITKIEPLEIQYLNALIRLLDHFGMSPSARGSIQISAPKENDEFGSWLEKTKNAQ